MIFEAPGRVSDDPFGTVRVLLLEDGSEAASIRVVSACGVGGEDELEIWIRISYDRFRGEVVLICSKALRASSGSGPFFHVESLRVSAESGAILVA